MQTSAHIITAPDIEDRLAAAEVRRPIYGQRLVRVMVHKPYQAESAEILVAHDDFLMITGRRPTVEELITVDVPMQERLLSALHILADRRPDDYATPATRRFLAPHALESLAIDGNEELRMLALQFISRICAAWLALLPPEDRLLLETDWLDVLSATLRHPAPGATHPSQATESPSPAPAAP